MEKLDVKKIASFVNGKIIGNSDAFVFSVSTDSRKASKNDLFIALKGEKFDGHSFIEQCIKNGVSAFIVSEDFKPVQNICFIRVDDTLKALQNLAKNYKQMFDIKTVAVTGSVGKTTTKDIIAKVLSQKYKVLHTYGNMNNHIGLPLNVLNLEKENEVAVFEMGMSGFYEISLLSDIAKPNFAVITNIGMSHIGNLGSQENILKAKLEIMEGLSKDGTVFLNGDDRLLSKLTDLPFKTIFFGINNEKCDFRATNIKTEDNKVFFDAHFNNEMLDIALNIAGTHNVYNALCAIAVSKSLGLTNSEIKDGLFKIEPFKMRMNIVEKKGVTIIIDCYNASPSSMKASIEVLANQKNVKRKIAILGQMLEMGEFEEKSHLEVGKFIADNKIDYLLTLGEVSRLYGIGAKKEGFLTQNILNFDTKKELNDYLKGFLKEGDAVLVKASRSIKMEEVSDHILQILE